MDENKINKIKQDFKDTVNEIFEDYGEVLNDLGVDKKKLEEEPHNIIEATDEYETLQFECGYLTALKHILEFLES